MRENNRHDCPGPDCKEQLPIHILMCRTHWWQVPRLIRTRVQQAWQNRGKAGGWDEYMDARSAAIAAVNGKQVKA